MEKVTVKNYGPALLLDADKENALVQLLKIGPAQNISVPVKDVTFQEDEPIKPSQPDHGPKENEKDNPSA